MPMFEARVSLPCSPEDAFDFLIRTENMTKISPPEMGLNFVEAPEIVEAGSRLEFKIQGYGQVQHIVHEIVTWERPRIYTEKQVEGPLKHWVHEHLFETDDQQQVTVIDRIEFEPPSGLLGFLITADRIQESLEDGFYHRHQQLKKLLEQSHK